MSAVSDAGPWPAHDPLRSAALDIALGNGPVCDLTKREWMATMIMAGLWAYEGDKDHSYEGAAQTVVEQADALLAELAK